MLLFLLLLLAAYVSHHGRTIAYGFYCDYDYYYEPSPAVQESFQLPTWFQWKLIDFLSTLLPMLVFFRSLCECARVYYFSVFAHVRRRIEQQKKTGKMKCPHLIESNSQFVTLNLSEANVHAQLIYWPKFYASGSICFFFPSLVCLFDCSLLCVLCYCMVHRKLPEAWTWLSVNIISGAILLLLLLLLYLGFSATLRIKQDQLITKC